METAVPANQVKQSYERVSRSSQKASLASLAPEALQIHPKTGNGNTVLQNYVVTIL